MTKHDHAAHSRHSHSHSHGASEQRLIVAAGLTGLFMVAEVIGGLVSGSLALIADAGHMLTDFVSLALAWFAFRLARRPADWKRTYGFDRFSILIAYTNGLALFGMAIWIVVEAWHRLNEPGAILGGMMFWIALAGLLVNILAFIVLQGGQSDNLNMRAAALHVAGDLLGSVAAIAAAIVIMLTGWTPIDPILSVLVAVIILRSAWHVVCESSHILLEGTPDGLDARKLRQDIVDTVPNVADIHHVHAWSITQERPMVTLHALLEPGADAATAVLAIKSRLRTEFGISHATVEVEYERCADEASDASHAHA